MILESVSLIFAVRELSFLIPTEMEDSAGSHVKPLPSANSTKVKSSLEATAETAPGFSQT